MSKHPAKHQHSLQSKEHNETHPCITAVTTHTLPHLLTRYYHPAYHALDTSQYISTTNLLDQMHKNNCQHPQPQLSTSRCSTVQQSPRECRMVCKLNKYSKPPGHYCTGRLVASEQQLHPPREPAGYCSNSGSKLHRSRAHAAHVEQTPTPLLPTSQVIVVHVPAHPI